MEAPRISMRIFFEALENAPYTIDITEWGDGDWKLIVICRVPGMARFARLLGTSLTQGRVQWNLDIAGRPRDEYSRSSNDDLLLTDITPEHKRVIEDMVMRLWKSRLFL
jgi:hypothetical protein